jgi:cobalt/nickel transport system ATP-binding protein
MSVIETHGLEYVYPDGTRALRGIDMSIEKKGKIAIVGPNGAGKSTLLLHFNGTLEPTAGSVLIDGNPIKYQESSLREVRRKVGIVFQDPDDQLFAPTVRQDVSYGPINLGLPRDVVEERVEWALKSVGMEGFEDKPPHFLSGGQKKRVAIAGILAMEPEVIVLDEPTSNLDPRGSEEVVNILDELNAELGTTIVISSHSMDLVARWAENAFVIHGGRLLGEGAPEELFNDKEVLRAATLRPPTVLRVYREMGCRGIISKRNPRVRLPLSLMDFADTLENEIPIRYAIANRDFSADEKVGLVLREGVLMAVPPEHAETKAFGKTLHPARKGDDIPIHYLNGEIEPSRGLIHVVRVPGIREGGSKIVNLHRIKKILDEKKPERIGAMGTSAKALVRKLDLPCQYDVEVIQAGIAAARRGMNVMIFASGKMAERAMRKIQDYSAENNLQIKCSLI